MIEGTYLLVVVILIIVGIAAAVAFFCPNNRQTQIPWFEVSLHRSSGVTEQQLENLQVRDWNANSGEGEEVNKEMSTEVDQGEASTIVGTRLAGNGTSCSFDPSKQERIQTDDVDSSSDCCGICLEPFASNERVCHSETMKCQHEFHEACVKSWLRRDTHCPTCRQEWFVDI